MNPGRVKVRTCAMKQMSESKIRCVESYVAEQKAEIKGVNDMSLKGYLMMEDWTRKKRILRVWYAPDEQLDY